MLRVVMDKIPVVLPIAPESGIANFRMLTAPVVSGCFIHATNYLFHLFVPRFAACVM